MAAVVWGDSVRIGQTGWTFTRETMCGASIIASRWAITAAHCNDCEGDGCDRISSIVLGLLDISGLIKDYHPYKYGFHYFLNKTWGFSAKPQRDLKFL